MILNLTQPVVLNPIIFYQTIPLSNRKKGLVITVRNDKSSPFVSSTLRNHDTWMPWMVHHKRLQKALCSLVSLEPSASCYAGCSGASCAHIWILQVNGRWKSVSTLIWNKKNSRHISCREAMPLAATAETSIQIETLDSCRNKWSFRLSLALHICQFESSHRWLEHRSTDLEWSKQVVGAILPVLSFFLKPKRMCEY